MDGDAFTLTTSTPKLDTADQILPHLNALKDSTTVTSIKLSGNTLGAPACEALASILTTKTSLRNVNLADIFTSRLLSEIPPALSSLLTALLPLKNLHTVDLSDNAFGLNTVEPLVEFLRQHVPLRHLILNNNGLGPNAGTLIADALTTLAAKKEEARRKDPSAEIPPLETIVIGRNRLESGSMPAWAKCFQAHSGLKVVKMVQNGIRQDGIALLLRQGLGKCEGLEVCDLQDNTFTITGARALVDVVGNWGKLKELGVGDCLVGARGMVAVAEALGKGKNAELRVLRAQYNEIDAKGVDALFKAAKEGRLEGLRRVELNGNKFSEEDEGVEGLRLLLGDRKEASEEAGEGEWGLDELSDLEEDSDEEEDGDQSEAESDEEEEVREGKAEKMLKEADQEENLNVPLEKDAEVDDLADQLGKAEIK